MKRIFRLPLSRDRVHRDVDAELSFHLEGRIEELVAGGMPRADAEREARQRFGDRAKVEAEVERIDVATVERRAFRERLDGAWRDARYAWRGLTRRPVYTVTVVLTLALGIGANTAIFSVFEAVLLHPFDIPAMGRLAVVHDDFPAMNLRATSVSPLETLDLFTLTDLFETAAVVSNEGRTTEIRNEPAFVRGAATMGEFFATFGARARYGRLYRPEDSQPGRPPVVVLSDAFWQQLSGDTAILGRTVQLNDQSYEVIGILPSSFAFPRTALYWRPFVLDSSWTNQERDRGSLTVSFVGRMRAGVTIDRLTSVLRVKAGQW